MLSVTGMGEAKLKKYGQAFWEVLKKGGVKDSKKSPCSSVNFPIFSIIQSTGASSLEFDILTIKDVAEYLKIKEKTAYKLGLHVLTLLFRR